MKLNRLEEAIKEFMIDIEKNPRNYRAYYNLAEIYE
jgi:tetratricopeptide (TPR) repeat protein